MRGGVDEVRESDEGGGETDGGAVKSGDEDFRVGVEGVCDFEVVGCEGLEPVAARGSGGSGEGARDGYVCAAGKRGGGGVVSEVFEGFRWGGWVGYGRWEWRWGRAYAEK